jgi:predicted dehydrogenase
MPLRVGILGCGDIAGTYASAIAASPALALAAAADRNPDRAQALTGTWGGVPLTSVQELLDRRDVDLVVILTRHFSHADLTEQALRAGKHVFSEKPLAMTGARAWRLVRTAADCGVRLGCAPATYLGEAQQTAWAALRTGLLGPVRVGYADVNWGRIESWHPRPQDFYAAGALFDMGVYPLTVLTSFFGPVQEVSAAAATVLPEREAVDGSRFMLTSPDLVVAMIRLRSGPLIRLTCGFYVDSASRQRGIELHGDDGSLLMERFYEFGAAVHIVRRGSPPVHVPLLAAPPPEPVDYGRALADMALAIHSGAAHRASGQQAAHVVDILEAIMQATRTGQRVSVSSEFIPPLPGAPGLVLPPDETIRDRLAALLGGRTGADGDTGTFWERTHK